MKYKAYIKVIENPSLIRVFPRSKKTCLFQNQEKAIKRLESLHLEGRGFVFPADAEITDISKAYTIAL